MPPSGFTTDVLETHWAVSLGEQPHPRRTRWAHAAVPLIVGALALVPGGIWAFELEILNGVAIITGLLFSLLVFLVQLRHQVRIGEAKAAHTAHDRANLDNGFYSSAYAIVIGFAILVLLILEAILGPTLQRYAPYGRIVSNWVIYALFSHFVMTMWVCARRLCRIYKVFGLNQP